MSRKGSKQRKHELYKRAQARAERRRSLTPAQQLALLDARGARAARERARLQAEMAEAAEESADA